MTNNTENLTPLKRFWRLLKPDKKEITNIYVYSIFNGLVNLSLPLGIQAIINLVQGGQVSTSWIVLVIFVVLGVLFTGILQIYQLKISEKLQQKIFTRAAFDFAYRIPKIKMEQLYKHYAPELMNRFFDVMSIQKGLSKILIEFSTSALHISFGLILLCLYHPFFIIFSIFLIAIVFTIFKLTWKEGLETSLEESKHKYNVVHWLEEIARTNTTFKLAGTTSLPLKQADEKTLDYLEARDDHFKVLVKQYSFLVAFKVLVATGLLAIGGILVMEQQMNIGQFVAAEIIILLIMNSVEKLVISLETIYDVLTSLEKIGQVTDLDLDKNDGITFTENLDEGGLKVELNNMSFYYPETSQFIFENLTLVINKGEKVIITGINGAGKSTILQLIGGLYGVQKGNISYNNLPIGNLKLSSLYNVIGDYLTHSQLFNGTVLDNIAMGRNSATFTNVIWAIENLGLSDFIKTLPKGFDTVLKPEGKGLSKSIQIRLLIARAIADKPRLLLLEDIFENIQEHEKNSIINFLIQKEHPWSLVAISSDNYFAKKADKIIVLNNGNIELTGTYSEVVSIANFKSNYDA